MNHFLHHWKPGMTAALLFFGCGAGWLHAAAGSDYASEVWPILEKYCVECHRDGDAKGGIDFSGLREPERYDADPDLLDRIIWVIESGEMPPTQSLQLEGSAQGVLLDWMEQRLAHVKAVNANDPGRVVLGRLNQAEYDNVIRDLTGFDLGLGRFFTPDPATPFGFTNMGEHLPMDPARLENYLAAAQRLMRHAYISPTRGIVWNAGEVELGGRQEELAYLGRQLIDWHNREEHKWMKGGSKSGLDDRPWRLDREAFRIADYLYLLWVHRHREVFGLGDMTVEELAEREGSGLQGVVARRWLALVETRPHPRMVGQILALAEAVPGPMEISQERAQELFGEIEEVYWFCLRPGEWYEHRGIAVRGQEPRPPWEVSEAQEPLRGILERFNERGFPEWAIDLRERARYTAELDLERFPGDRLYVVVTDAWDASEGDWVTFENGVWIGKDGSETAVVIGEGRPVRAPTTVELEIPQGATGFRVTAQLSDRDKGRAAVQVAFMNGPVEGWEQRYVPGRQVLAWPERRGRVGTRVHEETGLFGLLVQRAHASETRRGAPGWLLASEGFTGPELVEIGMAPVPPSVSPYALTAELVELVEPEARAEREAIVADLKVLGGGGLSAVQQDEMARSILARYLRQVWRRTPTTEEMEHLFGLYQSVLASEETFDAAVKYALTVALVSPQFLLKDAGPAPEEGMAALPGVVLASRLAFFLWASMPDERLLDLAESGGLDGRGGCAHVARSSGSRFGERVCRALARFPRI